MSYILIDTNILIYATEKGHPLYEKVLEKIKELKEEGYAFVLCHQVLREFIGQQLKGQPSKDRRNEILGVVEQLRKIYPVMSPFDDWENMDRLLSFYRNEDFNLNGGMIHDANIVSTMIHFEIKSILTHNVGDFIMFEPMIKVHTIQS